MQEPGEITVLLHRWNGGDEGALDQLVPHVYPHLHDLAEVYLRRESSGHTLQPTALVHELYLKLLQQRKAGWQDRAHFYVFAAKMMRRILTDHARAVHAVKRGSGVAPVPLSNEIAWFSLTSADAIDVNRALDDLETVDPRKVRLVELRYFLGCTVPESASLLNISVATAERDLLMVRNWLHSRLAVSREPS
ncbi:MAG: sigma-70 family RNA polymerase sigma factor [Acidobacteriia bacterium]|nr:sigma-70 family RNA polymerase sigma factor [Terriglobia bacterium]